MGERARPHARDTGGHKHAGSARCGIQFWHLDHERRESDPPAFRGEWGGHDQACGCQIGSVAEAHVDPEVHKLARERDNQLVHSAANSRDRRSRRRGSAQGAHRGGKRTLALECTAQGGHRGINRQLGGVERVDPVHDGCNESLERRSPHATAHERTDGGIRCERAGRQNNV